ncbi:hypothetical protein [Carboxylicivirga sp. N1Y90]|uniref:tetratricopeptide repeat protein n=1 Tax=Carboxylicivirga fragile TaxID=3417571 RepID=UPI003D357D5E|nr:hypothetical protein [Marinilabiliaceae bacterium N1Y90]
MKKLLFIGAALMFSCTLFAQENLSLMFSQERYSEVISQLEPNVDRNEDQQYLLASAYFQSGRSDLAIQCLLSADHTNSNLLKDLLSKVYFTSGQYAEALPICEDRFQDESMHLGNLMRYAQIQNFNSNYDNTINALLAYREQDSLNLNVNMLLAETFQKASEPLMAIDIYNKLLKQYPTNQKVGYRLAQLHYEKKQYKESFDVSMHFVDTLGYTKRFVSMAGLASFKARSNGNSVKLFKRMETRGDSSLLTKKHIGMAYHRMENYENAINYLYAAYDLKDDDVEVCFFLGAALGQSNMPMRGKPYLEKAAYLLAPSPGLMEKIHTKLAMMHEDSGNYTKAIAYYDSAYQYSPSNVQYIYNQAAIYDYYLENDLKAQELYEQFLTRLPDTLDSKKGNELYTLRLKEIVSNRLINIKEEAFFREGAQ